MKNRTDQAQTGSVDFSPQQLYALRSLHESFAAGLGQALEKQLHCSVTVHVQSVEQLRLSEYLFSREQPTCLVELEAEQLDGQWLGEVAPALAYALVDTLLGGWPSDRPIAGRPLSELEWRVLGRIFAAVTEELNAAWECVEPLSLQSIQSYSNPQLAQIAGPMENVIFVQLQLSAAGARGEFGGSMSLCLPTETLTQFTAHLLKEYFAATGQSSSRKSPSGWHVNSAERPGTESATNDICPDAAKTQAIANLARSTIGASDLMQLQVGDIVTTEQSTDDDLEIDIVGIGKYAAKAGSLNGQKAIEITRTPLDQRSSPTGSQHPQESASQQSYSAQEPVSMPAEELDDSTE